MKDRLDKILFDLGYFETKSKAQAAIIAGNVKINGQRITKAGFQLEYTDGIEIEVSSMPYVSRGGYKLAKALEVFDVSVKDRVCLDAGASTGGFTDCMLQNGAKKVYSVDVGYGQIAWKIRTDERVKVIERINIKKCFDYDIYSPEDERPDFCAADLSFISLTKVLENILTLMKPENIDIVTLIKPQFEAGKDEVGKNGVVRDKEIHIRVVNEIIEFAESVGLYALNFTTSPIKGPAGNTEYLVHFSDRNDKKQKFDVRNIILGSETEN